MDKLKLTYFDFPGGRAEPARLALRIGGIEFEDYRFASSDFPEVRKTTPLNQVPTLHINDLQITQSDAITRYVGKLTGLYPEDNLQALLCDEVMGALEDLNIKLVATFGMKGEALKNAREALVAGALPQYLRCLQHQLESIRRSARTRLRSVGVHSDKFDRDRSAEAQNAHASHRQRSRDRSILFRARCSLIRYAFRPLRLLPCQSRM
jgi:glutathione S-transferase